MEGDEQVAIRIKVQFPGEPVHWLVHDSMGFDTHPDASRASRYRDIGEAMEEVERIASGWPDATLSVVEEGWIGDWFSVNPTDAAFWRYRED